MERITFENMGNRALYAGLVGENEARSVSIDCSEVLRRHAGASVTMLLQLPNGTQAFPVACTVEDGIATHVFTAAEMQTSGYGKLSLTVSTTEGVIEKSAPAALIVGDTLLPGGETPPEVEDWLASLSGRLIPVRLMQPLKT